MNVFATIVVKKEKQSEIKPLLKELVANSQSDEGMIKYELNQDLNQKHIFYMTETWSSEKTLEKHLNMPHFKVFEAKSVLLLDEIKVIKFKKQVFNKKILNKTSGNTPDVYFLFT